MTLSIDVISDVVCPWCFIGKKKLERALAMYAGRNPQAVQPEVAWHPFQLNPDMPEAGMDRAEYLQRKFGGQSTQLYARVSAVGADNGIAFAFDKLARQPNTLAAHSLIMLAAESGVQNEVLEALFRAYFIDGRDLSDSETLAEVSSAAGLARVQVDGCLASEEARERARLQDAEARHLGIDGVPFFLFNRRHAVSGAQDPEVLLEAMLRAERDSVAADEV